MRGHHHRALRNQLANDVLLGSGYGLASHPVTHRGFGYVAVLCQPGVIVPIGLEPQFHIQLEVFLIFSFHGTDYIAKMRPFQVLFS